MRGIVRISRKLKEICDCFSFSIMQCCCTSMLYNIGKSYKRGEMRGCVTKFSDGVATRSLGFRPDFLRIFMRDGVRVFRDHLMLQAQSLFEWIHEGNRGKG